MEYTAVHFRFAFSQEFAADIFVAALAENGFESFENTEDGIIAYIPSSAFDRNNLQTVIENFPYEGVGLQEVITIADRNWNEEWEKHFFTPILIDEKCCIHSSFHSDLPHVEYDILIDPKMAFGTGHHATTCLIVSELLQLDLQGKSLLDMGCGTAVLAILAAMRGAMPVTAIDIDTWCVENAMENIQKNNVERIEVLLGDGRLLDGKHFDIILANINRNILLADMKRYADCLPQGGLLLVSGFYTEDVVLIEAEANKQGLSLQSCREQQNWAMAMFRKA